jgi:hypothetical protein
VQDSKLRSRLKAQLTKFSSELCGELSLPLEKFVGQMLFGIQASQDVKLSNIARSLKEEIPLIKTEDRLSRNLKAAELEAELAPQLAAMAGRRVETNTVLCLDLSDIRKEYARKMEYLTTIRDGSSGELHEGYWLCAITGAEVNGSEILPLYQKLYSTKARDFRGENAEVPSIWCVARPAAAASGPWIAAAIASNCWNPCWTGGNASSSVPRASAQSSANGTLNAAWPSLQPNASCATGRGWSRFRMDERRPTTCASAWNGSVCPGAASCWTWSSWPDSDENR